MPTTTKKSGPKKKSAAKKTTTKKTTRKKVGERELVYASNGESFWVSDGRILNSLLALHDTLNEIEKETFGNHVNSQKNDFADWVESVLCDADCAADLRKAKTAKGAKTVVVRHLKFYRL
ncbi:hypothetical protein KC887_04065 [Candidatus Kaiserbacteria bacterium]|nr:hypothetical protein [Candidatus Kaiserbacteria bacterium]